MSEYRVTSRYAKSLITLAQEQEVLEEVYADIRSFNDICQANRDFVLMLKNPVIRKEKKDQVIKKLFSGRVSKVTYSFFEIMLKKNREKFLPETAVEFKNQYNVLNKIGMAKVTTVLPLDQTLRDEFKRLVKEFTACKEVELEEITDEALVGGFVLTMGDRQMDESLKGKLKELELKFS
jgi:F-type H+-transporting ATPase subunit delta